MLRFSKDFASNADNTTPSLDCHFLHLSAETTEFRFCYKQENLLDISILTLKFLKDLYLIIRILKYKFKFVF